MKDIQMLEKAQFYLDMLAQSKDPTTGGKVDCEVLQRDQVKSVLQFTAFILNELAENHKTSYKSIHRAAFSTSGIDKSQIKISDSPIWLSSFVNRINEQVNRRIMRRLTKETLLAWLVSMGYILADRMSMKGRRKHYLLSDTSEEFGISIDEYVDKETGKVYENITLTQKAQEFIINNLEMIIGEKRAEEKIKEINADYNEEQEEFTLEKTDDTDVASIPLTTTTAVPMDVSIDEVKSRAKAVVEMIVETCRKISVFYDFGSGMIVNVLRGSQNKKVFKFGFEKLNLFGKLKSIKPDGIAMIIKYLVQKGILIRLGGARPAIRINPNKTLSNLSEADLCTIDDYINTFSPEKKVKEVKVAPTEFTDKVDGLEVAVDSEGRVLTDVNLLKRLYSLRRKLAWEKDVPPYYVAHNSVLMRIATKIPTTQEDFLQVKGVGSTWYKRHGHHFLAEILDYLGETE